MVLSSCVGYSLRAWANRYVDASVLVLYNAVQPPITILLELILDHGNTTYGVAQFGGTVMVMSAVLVSSHGESALLRLKVVFSNSQACRHLCRVFLSACGRSSKASGDEAGHTDAVEDSERRR